MNFISIDDGKWQIDLDGDRHEVPLGDRDTLRALFESHRVTNIMCSSSVDFADEYGAPEGFDAHGELDYAGSWMLPRIEELRRRARAVIDGTATAEEAADVAQALLKTLEAE